MKDTRSGAHNKAVRILSWIADVVRAQVNISESNSVKVECNK